MKLGLEVASIYLSRKIYSKIFWMILRSWTRMGEVDWGAQWEFAHYGRLPYNTVKNPSPSRIQTLHSPMSDLFGYNSFILKQAGLGVARAMQGAPFCTRKIILQIKTLRFLFSLCLLSYMWFAYKCRQFYNHHGTGIVRVEIQDLILH
jgi:hypothetical protein